MRSPSPPRTRSLAALGLCLGVLGCKHKQEPGPKPPPPPPAITTVSLPATSGPMVSMRLVFRAGSIDDPPGKEGVTAVAAQLMARGGTRQLSETDLQGKLFPMAAELGAQTDKEETVFYARVHQDFAAQVAAILADVVTAPRLDPKEFERVRTDAVNRITHGLRGGDDEGLAREAFINFIFAGHPYSSFVGGTVQGLSALTLDDVKKQMARVFTIDRLTLGVAGAWTPAWVEALKITLGKLPLKGAPLVELPAAPTQTRARVVDRPTDYTAMYLGYAWDVKRSDPDYDALAVGISALGEHRQTGGRLYDELRERRGLNFGDYAYPEHFVEDPSASPYALPNVALRQQYFSIWIRSLENANRLFALRAAEFEVKRIATQGITQEELDRTRGFLGAYTQLWEQRPDRKLGQALDDAFYATPGFLAAYREAMPKLTLDQVNAALKKHLDPTQLHVVIVTNGADAVTAELTGGKPAEDPAAKGLSRTSKDKRVRDLLADDKQISTFDLGLQATDIQVVRADELFEK